MSSHAKAGSTASLNKKLEKEQPEGIEEDAGQLEAELQEHLTYEELQAKFAETEEKLKYSMDRMLRLQADMDNMQRRVSRDIESAHKYGLEKFVLELLPIVDSFERAVSGHMGENASTDSVLDGINLTLKMLTTAFEKFGVQQINPEMQPFNPEQHQAVSTQEDPKVKPNTVVAVLQKGYLLNNRLIRPALVVVSK